MAAASIAEAEDEHEDDDEAIRLRARDAICHTTKTGGNVHCNGHTFISLFAARRLSHLLAALGQPDGRLAHA